MSGHTYDPLFVCMSWGLAETLQHRLVPGQSTQRHLCKDARMVRMCGCVHGVTSAPGVYMASYNLKR